MVFFAACFRQDQMEPAGLAGLEGSGRIVRVLGSRSDVYKQRSFEKVPCHFHHTTNNSELVCYKILSILRHVVRQRKTLGQIFCFDYACQPCHRASICQKSFSGKQFFARCFFHEIVARLFVSQIFQRSVLRLHVTVFFPGSQ